MPFRNLDCSLVSETPTSIWLGELPWDYALSPAPVVVNLCGVYPPAYPSLKAMLCLPMQDSLDESTLPARADFERFLAAVHALAEVWPTYWHCHAGINRSGFALAAYLHRYRSLRISDAIETLRAKRSSMVLCNNVFERTLRAWYGARDEQAFGQFTLEDFLAEARRHKALAATREREIAEIAELGAFPDPDGAPPARDGSDA